jgi:hypothetical protein
VSVSTFLERLRALPEQPLAGAAAARELLAARGLGAATLTEVEDLLKKLPTVREPPSPIGPTLEEQTVAENAMWDWYLEWAQIARATLHDRRLLRQLGFLKRRGGAEVGEPLDEVSGTAEEEDEVALAAAS